MGKVHAGTEWLEQGTNPAIMCVAMLLSCADFGIVSSKSNGLWVDFRGMYDLVGSVMTPGYFELADTECFRMNGQELSLYFHLIAIVISKYGCKSWTYINILHLDSATVLSLLYSCHIHQFPLNHPSAFFMHRIIFCLTCNCSVLVLEWDVILLILFSVSLLHWKTQTVPAQPRSLSLRSRHYIIPS